MPDESTLHSRLSAADLLVHSESFAAFRPPGHGISNFTPPGVVVKTGTPSSFFPKIYTTWQNGNHLFVPSLVPEGSQFSLRHSFLSLARRQINTTPYRSAKEHNHEALDLKTPPSSPFELDKLSPSLSVHTLSTIDSYESSRSFTSTPENIDQSPQFRPTRPYIRGQEITSLQRALWAPPRSIEVCHMVNENDPESPSSVPDLSRNLSHGSSQSPQGRKKSILAQSRAEHDPIRKSRIKTEMCLHFINKTQCPFGSNCTYAHGEDELQLTKLMDLHEAGLVDACTYRTVPCLTFVATGSCPFGKRCHGIHDPRVAGDVQSWLPHTETQGNTIATDINVDALHQKRLYSTLHNNPFGALFSPGETSFEELYSLVCNTTQHSSIKKTKKGYLPIEDHHKVSIALQMRGPSNFQFKFRPQHIVYEELCMVLQKRAFRLTSTDVVEIPLNSYDARSAKEVLVREIAFGPDCDPTVRGVGLWFDISESDVTVCTPQQAKRFRWKRGIFNKKGRHELSDSRSVDWRFDCRETFSMIRPSERDAYDIATRMLRHRLDVLRAETILNPCARSKILDELNKDLLNVKTSFDGLLRSWKNWTWPVNKGRERVDNASAVPSIDARYNPIQLDMEDTVSTVHQVWENFASAIFLLAAETGEENGQENILATTPDFNIEAARLTIFKRLAEGSSSEDVKFGSMPHISNFDDGFKVTGSQALQSRRCWQSLLLKSTTLNEYNEWGLVSDHFQNSRSRKVLSILQSH